MKLTKEMTAKIAQVLKFSGNYTNDEALKEMVKAVSKAMTAKKPNMMQQIILDTFSKMVNTQDGIKAGIREQLEATGNFTGEALEPATEAAFEAVVTPASERTAVHNALVSMLVKNAQVA